MRVLCVLMRFVVSVRVMPCLMGRARVRMCLGMWMLRMLRCYTSPLWGVRL